MTPPFLTMKQKILFTLIGAAIGLSSGSWLATRMARRSHDFSPKVEIEMPVTPFAVKGVATPRWKFECIRGQFSNDPTTWLFTDYEHSNQYFIFGSGATAVVPRR